MALLASSVAFAQPALAQAAADKPSDATDTVEEITVTAQKRGENLQAVPVTVSAFTAAGLERAGITSITQLQQITPGLTTPIAGGLVQPFIRGVGNAVISVGNESSVATYVDGVYYARLPFVFFELSDIERVEVLKGPQGTLFGRNASGGLIHIITRDPTDTLSGKMSVGYGNYDTYRADAFVGGPVADGVKASISTFYMKQNDGWGKNLITGKDQYRQEAYSVRGKLLADLGERTTAKLTGEYLWGRSDIAPATPYEGTMFGAFLPPYHTYPQNGFYNTYRNLSDVRTDKGWGTSLTLRHDLDFADLVSISAYHSDKGDVPALEGDYTDQNASVANLAYSNKIFTQEVQLASRKSDSFDWIVGVYYLWTKGGFVPAILGGPRNGNATIVINGTQTINSYAGFGQGTYHVTPTTNLTLGLRYSIDDVKARGTTDTTLSSGTFIPGAILTPSTNFKKLTWKAALDQELAQHVMAYASASRGYKSGTYNTIPVSTVVARPEVLDAYEIGLKTKLFDRRVRLNFAGFYYNFKNPQVQIINGPRITTQNAEKARVKGVEVDGEIVVARGLNLTFGAAYTDGKYKSYRNAVFINPNPNTNPALGIVGGNGAAASGDASGNRTPRTPKFTANAGFSYHLESDIGGWDLDANLYHNSGFYWQPDNRLHQRAYDVMNAGLTYSPPDSQIKVRGWGKNLANKHYYQSTSETAGQGGDPAIPAAPRTYGVTVSASF